MKKMIALLMALVMVLCLFAGCAKKAEQPAEESAAPVEEVPAEETVAPEEEAPAEEAPADEEPTEEAAPAVTKITVGLMSGFQPYCYMNDDGSVGGFDAEVVQEAANRLGIEVEWLVVPWESLMVSLDADKCQIVSSQLWRTEERCAQYTMAKVPYFECGGQLLVAVDNNDITSLATVGDAAIGTTVGDAWTTYLEQYNEDNNNVLNLTYYSEDIAVVIQDVANGRVAATLNDPVVMWEKVKAQNLDNNVKLVGSLEGSGCCYTAFQKTADGEALRDMFDEVYLEMIEDGTMAELSVKWFGSDYSGNLLDNVVEE